MVTAIIVLGSILAYLACYVIVARAWYQHLQPSKEPLDCAGWDPHNAGRPGHRHLKFCYRKPGYAVDSDNEALWWAMFIGFLGPVAILGMGLIHFITAGDRKPVKKIDPDKVAALEKELGM